MRNYKDSVELFRDILFYDTGCDYYIRPLLLNLQTGFSIPKNDKDYYMVLSSTNLSNVRYFFEYHGVAFEDLADNFSGIITQKISSLITTEHTGQMLVLKATKI